MYIFIYVQKTKIYKFQFLLIKIQYDITDTAQRGMVVHKIVFHVPQASFLSRDFREIFLAGNQAAK